MSKPPLLFLDIDGVLNDHKFDAGARSCTIHPPCVRAFNRVLAETGAKVVLSTAWRYMVLGGDMTLTGFTYMLQTHGVAGCEIIGTTRADEDCVICDHARGEANCAGEGNQPTCPRCRKQCRRADWIVAWVADNGHCTRRWVVLDDLALPGLERRHVRTQGDTGLTEADADRAIELLTTEAAGE